MPLKSAHPAARPDTAILRSVTAFLAAFGLATVISVSAQAAGQSPQTSAERVAQLRPTGVAAGRYIVVFEDSVARSQVRANAIALARANGFALRHVYSTALKGFAAFNDCNRIQLTETSPRDWRPRLQAQLPD